MKASIVVRLLDRSSLSRYVVPFLLGLVPLIWILPGNNIILGQDSLAFFIHPFNPTTSPLVSYNLAGIFPFNYYLPELYPTIISAVVQNFGLGPIAAEQIFLVVVSEVACFGTFTLFRLIDRLNGKDPALRLSPKILATLIYLVNPFTLSVSWWRLEQWTFLWACIPFIISTELDILYSPRASIRLLAVSALVLVLFDEGVFGPFFIAFLFSISLTLIFLLSRLVQGVKNLREVARRVSLLLCFTLTTLWSIVPFILLSLEVGQSPSALYLGSTSGGQLQELLAANSANANLLNVLNLTGILRLAPQFGNLYYSWYVYYPVIAVGGLLIAALFCVYAILCHRFRGFYFLVIVALAIIPLCVGANPPFGSFNLLLLTSSGVFSVLVSGYPTFIEYYLVALVAGIYSLLVYLDVRLDRLPFFAAEQERGLPPPADLIVRPATRPHSFRNCAASVTLVVCIATLLAVSVPFVAQRVTPSTGPNVGEFQLPESFNLLNQFLNSNYTGPFFYALVLPMSAIAGYYYEFGDSSLIETSHLIDRYVPYPVLSTNGGPLPESLDNTLADGIATNPVPLLQALHVKYVIMNPFYNATAWFMTEAPNGKSVNLTHIQSLLNSTVGAPSIVGSFEVYTLSGTTPLLQATTSLQSVQTPTFDDYLSFLAGINSSVPSLSGSLNHALWSNFSVEDASPINLYNLDPAAPNQFPQCLDCSTYLELTNGSIVSPQDLPASYLSDFGTSENGSLTNLHPYQLYGPENYSTTTTNLDYSAQGWTNPPESSGYVQLPLFHSVGPTVIIDATVDLSQLAAQNWISFVLESGNVSLNAIIYEAPAAADCALLMSPYIEGNLYAINNTAFAFPCQTSPLNLSVILSSSQAIATLSPPTSSGSEPIKDSLGLVLSNAESNPFSNRSLAPTSTGFPYNFTVNITVRDVAATISDPKISSAIPMTHLLTTPSSEPNLSIQQIPGVASDNAFSLNVHESNSSAVFVTLFQPASPLWSASWSDGVGIRLDAGPGYNVWQILLGAGPLIRIFQVLVQFSTLNSLGIILSIVEISLLLAVILVTSSRRLAAFLTRARSRITSRLRNRSTQVRSPP